MFYKQIILQRGLPFEVKIPSARPVDISTLSEVEVSEQADCDLREIFEYIAFELQSPENVIGQLNRLEEQILSLDAMPKLIELWGMNIRTDVEAKKTSCNRP